MLSDGVGDGAVITAPIRVLFLCSANSARRQIADMSTDASRHP